MTLDFQKKLIKSLFSKPEFINGFVNSNDIDLSFDNNILLYEIFNYLKIFGLKSSLNENSIVSLEYLLNDTKVLINLQRYLEDCNNDIIDYVIAYLKKTNNIKYIDFNNFKKFNLNLTQKFISSCKNGNYKIFKELIKNPQVKTSFNFNSALYECCKNGRVKMFKELIISQENDPSDCSQRCLYAAISKNSYNILSILLKDKRIDLTKHENYALFHAINQHCYSYSFYKSKCLSMLEDDKRIKIEDFNNSVLYNLLLSMNSYFNNPKQANFDNYISNILKNKNVQKNINKNFLNKLINNTFEIEKYYLFKNILYISKLNNFSNF